MRKINQKGKIQLCLNGMKKPTTFKFEKHEEYTKRLILKSETRILEINLSTKKAVVSKSFTPTPSEHFLTAGAGARMSKLTDLQIKEIYKSFFKNEYEPRFLAIKEEKYDKVHLFEITREYPKAYQLENKAIVAKSLLSKNTTLTTAQSDECEIINMTLKQWAFDKNEDLQSIILTKA